MQKLHSCFADNLLTKLILKVYMLLKFTLEFSASG